MKLPIPSFIRRHPWRYGIALLVLIPVIAFGYMASKPKQPPARTTTAARQRPRLTMRARIPGGPVNAPITSSLPNIARSIGTIASKKIGVSENIP